MSERDLRITELKQRLAELEARFHTEVLLRGFDPAQLENMALPAALARLAEERAELNAELEETSAAGQTGAETA